MSDEILRQMASELAEIRKLLSAVLNARQDDQGMAELKAEQEMVDALGLDRVAYLKNKYRKPDSSRRKKKSRPGQ